MNPLLHRLPQPARVRPVRSLVSRIRLAAPIRKRAGIRRILQDGSQRGFRGRFPKQLPGKLAHRVPARQQELVATEVVEHLPTTPQFPKLLKD
jgi:hypothetical protein